MDSFCNVFCVFSCDCVLITQGVYLYPTGYPMAAHIIEARLSSPSNLPRVKRDQLKVLEDRFRETRNPTESDLMLIAAEVGLSEEHTRVSSGSAFPELVMAGMHA